MSKIEARFFSAMLAASWKIYTPAYRRKMLKRDDFAKQVMRDLREFQRMK